MTNEQTKEQFLIALNTNAYLGMCEAADMVNAIKALEKQIPKMVYEKRDNFGNLHDICPNCKRYVEDCYGYSYCKKCGQKLDFSDVCDT